MFDAVKRTTIERFREAVRLVGSFSVRTAISASAATAFLDKTRPASTAFALASLFFSTTLHQTHIAYPSLDCTCFQSQARFRGITAGP